MFSQSASLSFKERMERKYSIHSLFLQDSVEAAVSARPRVMSLISILAGRKQSMQDGGLLLLLPNKAGRLLFPNKAGFSRHHGQSH